jgi:hypothetical protein
LLVINGDSLDTNIYKQEIIISDTVINDSDTSISPNIETVPDLIPNEVLLLNNELLPFTTSKNHRILTDVKIINKQFEKEYHELQKLLSFHSCAGIKSVSDELDHKCFSTKC